MPSATTGERAKAFGGDAPRRLALYRASMFAASVLPGPWSCSMALGLGRVLGKLPDRDGKRAMVASHMQRALGRPLHRREQRALVADVFANYARYWAESFRLPSLDLGTIAAGVTTEGEQHLNSAVQEGNGVIIAAPHLGGWEWGAMYLIARGLPVTVAVEPLQPPELFEWFAAFRRRLGMNVVPVGPGAGGAILKALHEGHVVCLLSDRLVGDASGVEVTFFDGQALMPAGPATLAVRSGAPLMTAAIYFGKSADAHRLVFRPALHLPTEGRFQQRARAITQLLAVELEELVRAAPSQWHIVQPNWLDDPPLRSGGRRGAVAASPNRSPL